MIDQSIEDAVTSPLVGEEKPTASQLSQLWSFALQIMRFGIVGLLNTGIDILIYNVLVWFFPTQNVSVLFLLNSIAYILGSLNSFIMNKYWTFRQRQHTTFGEVAKFAATTAIGTILNSVLLTWATTHIHLFTGNALLSANASKIIAIFGTMLISFVGMRLWVFVKPAGKGLAQTKDA